MKKNTAPDRQGTPLNGNVEKPLMVTGSVKMNRGVIHRWSKQKYWPYVALICVILLGTLLRLGGIRFGLPFAYHVDEPTYVSAALNLGAGQIGRQLNPPVFSNLLFVEYGTFYLMERIFGDISSVAQFESLYRTDPSMFFLLGRLTSASMGIITILLVYLIGRKLSGQLLGILAALLISVSFLHVRDSHFAVPDVLMTMLVTAAVFFCLSAQDRDMHKFYCLAALFSGMAISSKWSAWPVLIPLAFVILLWMRRNISSGLSRNRFFLVGALVFLSLLAGFFLSGFQLLINPKDYFNYAMTELRSGSSGGFGIWQIDDVPGYIFYLNTLWIGLGGVICGLSVVGTARRIRTAYLRQGNYSVVLLLFPIVYFGIMGATRHYFARYALPLIPFVVLFAAEAMIAIAAWLELKRKKIGWIFLAVLVLAAAVPTLLNSLRFDYLMTRTDTRTTAKTWIEKNIPGGSKIAVDWPIHVPSLSTDRYNILEVGGTGLADHPVEYYRQSGFDYLITSSFIYEIPLVVAPLDRDRNAFYDSLKYEADLLKEFFPSDDFEQPPFVFDEIYGPFINLWGRERPGPVLRVYRLTN